MSVGACVLVCGGRGEEGGEIERVKSTRRARSTRGARLVGISGWKDAALRQPNWLHVVIFRQSYSTRDGNNTKTKWILFAVFFPFRSSVKKV